MGNKIRAQIGKNNTLGNGNDVTQIGNGNQNNSNNTTINNYSTPNSSDDSGVWIIKGLAILAIFASVIFFNLKYYDYIKHIKWINVITAILPILFGFKLYIDRDLDKKDFWNSFCIVIISGILFSSHHKLYQSSDFINLAKFSYKVDITGFWDSLSLPKNKLWLSKAIYFMVTNFLSLSFMVINICFTILFVRYSLGNKQQSNLIREWVTLILSFGVMYLIIEPDFLLNLIFDLDNIIRNTKNPYLR